MADAELLLTIDGTDVTADVWQWASVSYTDAWDQHPSLSFTLRQAYGSVGTYAAYDDVRLVNLLTGAVLFEGIIQPGELVQTERDPGWVESFIRCVGYQQLFDTARVQADLSWEWPVSYSAAPQAADMLRTILAASFADARVPIDITTQTYSGPYTGGYILDAAFAVTTRDGLSATIAALLGACVTAWGDYSGVTSAHPHVAKLLPGVGLVITAPDMAPRGTAPVTLTPASFGRPSSASEAVMSDDVGSFVWATPDGGTTWELRDDGRSVYTDPTNGYVVFGNDIDNMASPGPTVWWLAGGGLPRTAYRIVSPLMPHDVLVGHELTFSTPWLGSVTGVVQSVQTTFTDGVFDADAAAWPYFLDGTKTLDGLWDLDDTTSRSIPRRMRRSTIILAASNTAPATPRRTVKRLRKGTF